MHKVDTKSCEKGKRKFTDTSHVTLTIGHGDVCLFSTLTLQVKAILTCWASTRHYHQEQKSSRHLSVVTCHWLTKVVDSQRGAFYTITHIITYWPIITYWVCMFYYDILVGHIPYGFQLDFCEVVTQGVRCYTTSQIHLLFTWFHGMLVFFVCFCQSWPSIIPC